MKPFYLISLFLLLLAGCVQDKGAPIEYRGGTYYGKQGVFDREGNELPRYSESNPAEMDEEIADKYDSDTQQYGVNAEVGSVITSDLPPPAAPEQPRPLEEPPHSDVSDSDLTASPPLETVRNEDYRPLPDESAADTIDASPPPDQGLAADELPAPPPAEGETPRFIWPARGEVMTRFGVERDGEKSEGISIAARSGEPIRASADGLVVYSDDVLQGYGNMVIVRHAGDWLSAYGHANELVVRKGDNVVKGQLIGFVGKSGNVKTPQLLFSLRKSKQPVDPLPLLADE